MELRQEQATERVVTLMTRTEKTSLEARAASAGVSIGEFVRRSVDAYDPDEIRQLEQLATLAREFKVSAERAVGAVDRANASVENALGQLSRKRGA